MGQIEPSHPLKTEYRVHFLEIMIRGPNWTLPNCENQNQNLWKLRHLCISLLIFKRPPHPLKFRTDCNVRRIFVMGRIEPSPSSETWELNSMIGEHDSWAELNPSHPLNTENWFDYLGENSSWVELNWCVLVTKSLKGHFWIEFVKMSWKNVVHIKWWQ